MGQDRLHRKPTLEGGALKRLFLPKGPTRKRKTQPTRQMMRGGYAMEADLGGTRPIAA